MILPAMPDFLDWNTVLRAAESMRIFAGDDKTFNMGQWRDWKRASEMAGKWLDPADFKKTSQAGSGVVTPAEGAHLSP